VVVSERSLTADTSGGVGGGLIADLAVETAKTLGEILAVLVHGSITIQKVKTPALSGPEQLLSHIVPQA
jgi:hypothetical protein